MGNHPNSNSNFCFFINPFSPCSGSQKNSDSVQASKISKSSFAASKNKNSIAQNNPQMTKPHYSPLIFSQSFVKDSPHVKFHESFDNEFQINHKSYPGNHRLTANESMEFEIEGFEARLSSVMNTAIEEMVRTETAGKKTLNLVFQTSLTISDMIYISEAIIKARPFHYLSLDFNRTNINDAEILPLSKTFDSLQNIEGLELLLQNNHITYLGGKALIKSLEKVRELKIFSINLNYNLELSGNALEELAEEIGNLEKLEQLSLELQAVRLSSSDLFFIELLNSLNKCKCLKTLHLNLSENMLKSNILNFFLNGMKNISSKLLELHLILNHNPLSYQDFCEIFHLFEESIELKSILLGFRGCKLELDALEMLLIVLSKLKTMRYLNLDLEGNSFKVQNQRFLVDYINPESSFPTIERVKLNLSDCDLDRAVLENIAFVLHCMRKVRDLSLVFQKSKDKSFEQIICCLPNFQKLLKLKLDMKNSDFGPEIFEVLTLSLQHLKSLRSLKLNFYKIPAFATKDCKEFCKLAANIECLQKIRMDVRGKQRKKCVEGLVRFINYRNAFLGFGLKFRKIHSGFRQKLLLNYAHNIFFNPNKEKKNTQ